MTWRGCGSDVTMVVDAFKLARNRQANSTRCPSGSCCAFFEVLDFAPPRGAAGRIPPRFAPPPRPPRSRRAEANEDEIGKAIPEAVIRQLDRHLALSGRGSPTGPCPPKRRDRHVPGDLRDPPRHRAPHRREVAGLAGTAWNAGRDEYSLVWDNGKGRRLRRRRLPIQQGPPARSWTGRRPGHSAATIPANAGLPVPGGQRRRLQLQHLDRLDTSPARSGSGPTRSPCWTPRPPDGTGPGAVRPREDLPVRVPAHLRQRHANAGTPIDVLAALMDHKPPAPRPRTTRSEEDEARGGRRRCGCTGRRPHRPPGPHRPRTTAYEMRSVAVPWEL